MVVCWWFCGLNDVVSCCRVIGRLFLGLYMVLYVVVLCICCL